MKKFICVLLMLSTTTLFAATSAAKTITLAQVVNVDGTTSKAADSSGSGYAYTQGVQIKSGETAVLASALIVAAIGIGIGVSNKNDNSKGNGHLTHASQRTH